MRIIKDDNNAMGTNSYLFINDNKDCYIIDAPSKLVKFQEIIEKEGLKVKYILLTHSHFDHIMGLQALLNKYKVPLVCHKDEKIILNNSKLNLSNMVGDNMTFEADIYLEGIKGKFDIFDYILTPGHTPGGVNYKIEKYIFTGDSLFNGSIGRTDFPMGDYKSLIKSLKERILVLDGDSILYPGHGPESTIAFERNNNPFLI